VVDLCKYDWRCKLLLCIIKNYDIGSQIMASGSVSLNLLWLLYTKTKQCKKLDKNMNVTLPRVHFFLDLA